MVKPKWVKFVGVIFVIIGLFGVVNGAILVKMMPSAKVVMKSMTKDLDTKIQYGAGENREIIVKENNAEVTTNDKEVVIKSQPPEMAKDLNIKINGPMSEETANKLTEEKHKGLQQVSNYIEEYLDVYIYIDLVISSMYLLSGILIFVINKYAIPVSYATLLIAAISNFYPLINGESISIVTLVFHIIFIVILATGDKKIFETSSNAA